MSGAAPEVSIVILGYNGREHVEGCLSSVLDQDFERPYEVLFVDNGSRDGTADAAARHQGVRVVRLDHNHGYCGGNNVGADEAAAPLLVFLNQDVVVHKSWLRELVGAVESDPAIKAAHPNVVHPWNPEFAAKERLRPLSTAYAAELSALGFVQYREAGVAQRAVDTLFLSGVSMILKRDVLPEIGGYVFDPDMFMYGEDMDLALRIRGAGYRTVAATRAVIYHSHVLADSLSLGSFLKTVRIIRNRILALWKSSGWVEFAPLFAITVLGAPFNSTSFGLPPWKRALYALLLVPPALAAGAAALAAMPRYAGRRRDILSLRKARSGWILKALLSDRARLRDGVPVEAAGRAGA